MCWTERAFGIDAGRMRDDSYQDGNPSSTAEACPSSVLLIEAMKQPNRRLSISSTLSQKKTRQTSRTLFLFSALSVMLVCFYLQYNPDLRSEERQDT
jgi:hypothetical protein